MAFWQDCSKSLRKSFILPSDFAMRAVLLFCFFPKANLFEIVKLTVYGINMTEKAMDMKKFRSIW